MDKQRDMRIFLSLFGLCNPCKYFSMCYILCLISEYLVPICIILGLHLKSRVHFCYYFFYEQSAWKFEARVASLIIKKKILGCKEG